MKNNTLLIILFTGINAVFSQNVKSSIEFYDTTANAKTGEIGWIGNAQSGTFFIDANGEKRFTITGDTTTISGKVKANSFVGDGSKLTGIVLDSTRASSVADSSKKIPDGSVINSKLATSLKIKDENIDSISWSKIKGIPAGFADGIDNTGGATADSVRAAFISDTCKKIPIVTDAKIDSVNWTKIKNKPTKIDTSSIALRADSLGSFPAIDYLKSSGIDASVIKTGSINRDRISTDFTGKVLKIDTIYAGNAPQYDSENPMLHVCPQIGAAKLRLATNGDYQSGVEFFHNGTQSWYIFNDPANGELKFFNDNPRLFLNQQGHLGIGTSATNYPLEVNGDIKCDNIRTSGVIVNGVNLNVPDYVFENNFNLRSLKAVETYIDVNKHLPDIQSAQEIKEKGIDIVKMNLDLLKKVEELTLYVINQNKQIDSIQIELKNLKNSNIK